MDTTATIQELAQQETLASLSLPWIMRKKCMRWWLEVYRGWLHYEKGSRAQWRLISRESFGHSLSSKMKWHQILSGSLSLTCAHVHTHRHNMWGGMCHRQPQGVVTLLQVFGCWVLTWNEGVYTLVIIYSHCTLRWSRSLVPSLTLPP